MFRTISAKDVTPEEIAQVREAIEGFPDDSVMREFITELLDGLDAGLNMTLFSSPWRVTNAEALSMMTGYSEEELKELGGVPEDEK